MGTDYIAAIAVRYGLFLLASGIARSWVLPLDWSDPIALATFIYLVVIIQTEPAARYARRAPSPWFAWTFLCAACAHAFGGAASYALAPLIELRFHDPESGGINFVKLWVNEPSVLEAGFWIVLYAIVSAGWAVLVGGAARAIRGAAPPASALIRIRKRGAASTPHSA